MEKRLQTILARAGVASRRHAAELIEAGKVSVDGVSVTEKGMRIDPAKHKITVDGKLLAGEEEKHYYLLNKPAGYICTVTDTHGRRKITDLFTRVNARLYPVGRLDKDTTGVIIVTNDGDFAYGLSHPSFEVDKEYIVTVAGDVTSHEIIKMRKGVNIEGGVTAPCEVHEVRKTKSNTILRIVIHEGRKRQIKQMLEAVGFEVVGLDRVRYAGLTSGKLKNGEFRKLTEKEIKKLKRI